MRNIRYFGENGSVTVFLFVPLLITWVLYSADSATGQSARGTITGIAKDPSGAVAPGAHISIVEKSTGVITQATSTGAGVYRAPYIPPGKHRISVSLAGFKTAIADNVDVLVGQTVTVDFTLEVGQVSQQVTVSAETPLLESPTSQIGANTRSARREK